MTNETKTRKGHKSWAVVSGEIVNTTTIRTDWRGTAAFRLRRITELESQLEQSRAAQAEAERERNRLSEQAQRSWDERGEYLRHLRNLLARIHRDGGHYVEEHGLEKAVEDAHQVWAELRLKAEDPST